MRIFGFELFKRSADLRSKDEAERLTLLRDMGLVVSLEEIEAGTLQVFQFRRLPQSRPFYGEVWATLKSDATGWINERFPKDAKLVYPPPNHGDLERVAKKLNVESWDVAIERRPRNSRFQS